LLLGEFQEKPKEKTIFNVCLESFESGAKPKIIREVKALVPNLTLIDVGLLTLSSLARLLMSYAGQEIRGDTPKGP
jgi:hypothetical protein